MFRIAALFTRLYGANPLHLVAVLGCFALSAYSVSFVVAEPSVAQMFVWFGAAVVVHDLVLLPVYALADRTLVASRRVLRRGRSDPGHGVSVVNYVRIPVLGSGLLFLLFLPGIIEQGTATHLAATGQDQQPYFGRWLAIAGVFAVVSAAVYLLRLLHHRLRRGYAESADTEDGDRPTT